MEDATPEHAKRVLSPEEAASLLAEPLTDEERVDLAVTEAFAARGYIDEDGERDSGLLADVLVVRLRKAEAADKNDRNKVQIRRGEELVEVGFPGFPGPAAFGSTDDPVFTEAVWNRLESECWRCMNIQPNGLVQRRLDNGTGLVLVKRPKSRTSPEAVYVTREIECLKEDVCKPVRQEQLRRANRDAILTNMLIDRVPEHAKVFNNELQGGLRAGLKAAEATVAATLSAALKTNGDGDE